VSRSDLRNIPASVRARLLNEARQRGESYDQILQYFAIERFLYRLSKTEWGCRLILKGAIMLRAWETPLGRPTRDIDFLGEHVPSCFCCFLRVFAPTARLHSCTVSV